MTAPSIGSSTSNGTASGTSHAINLPSGIVAGNILVAGLGAGGTTFTWPGGWNSIVNSNGLGIAWRLADGSEGATVTVTSAVSQSGACISYRITGADTTANVEAATTSNGNTATPNPPNLAPSWGSADVLWFALTTRSATVAPTAFPTNYGLGQISQNNSASTGSLHSCARQLTASSEDPGVFTFAASSPSQSATLAVKGSSASFIFNPNPMLPLLVR